MLKDKAEEAYILSLLHPVSCSTYVLVWSTKNSLFAMQSLNHYWVIKIMTKQEQTALWLGIVVVLDHFLQMPELRLDSGMGLWGLLAYPSVTGKATEEPLNYRKKQGLWTEKPYRKSLNPTTE